MCVVAATVLLKCLGLRAAAERLGVVAEPEIVSRPLSASVAFVVLASDGVFEFMSNQEVVDLVRAARPCYRLLGGRCLCI